MGKLDGLQPESVFRFFEEICGIPHGSGNVDGISDYLVSFAKERNLYYIQDKVKNEVESMTGLSVATVNVSVDGVNVPITDDAAKEPEKADAAKATDGE